MTEVATFAADSCLSPTNQPGAARGTYTVVTAGSIADNGLTLDPTADSNQWSFAVTGGSTLKATYVPLTPPGAVLIVR